MKKLLLSLLLALCAPLAHGVTFTYVTAGQLESDGSSTSIVLSAQNVASGALLVCGARWEGGGVTDTATATLADTAGNTYTNIGYRTVGSGTEDEKVGLWYVLSATANATNVTTFTISSARTYRRGFCAQYTYTGGPITLGDTGAGSAVSPATSFTSSPALNVVSGDLIAGWMGWYDTGQTVAHTGYTRRDTFASTVIERYFDKMAAGTGTDTPNGSITGGDSYAILTAVFKAASSPPTFSISPTVTSQTDAAYTLGYTPSASATFYTVACIKDQTAPTIAQVKAGNCTGNVAAQAAANEAVTGADTTVLGGSLTFPIYDVYAVLNNGSGDSSLVTLADEALDPPTGYQHVTLASISATSWCDAVNDSQTPDMVAGDILRISAATSPSAFTWTQLTDCDGSYPGDSSRQSLTANIYDVSAGGLMSYGPVTIWFNNAAPVGNDLDITLPLGESFSINLCTSQFTDADADTLTGTNSSTGEGTGDDKHPADSTLSDCTWSSDATSAEGEGNFTFTATDITGDSDTITVNWIVEDSSISVPDCEDIDLASCLSLLTAADLQAEVTATTCSNTIASGNIISQSPTAGSGAESQDTVSLTISSGVCPTGDGMVGGTAISDGQMVTAYLDSETAVPGGAVFVNGFAHTTAGARYVAQYSAQNIIISGIARRLDGAMIIKTDGTAVATAKGFSVTSLGEVVAQVCSPTVFVRGWGMLTNGVLCISEAY